MEQNIRHIDKNRASTREIIGGGKWGERSAYHLIVNTTGWSIKELTPAVADFATRWFGPGVKFCVSDFRQESRMALESRADSGLNPLITESHGGQNGMRAGTA